MIVRGDSIRCFIIFSYKNCNCNEEENKVRIITDFFRRLIDLGYSSLTKKKYREPSLFVLAVEHILPFFNLKHTCYYPHWSTVIFITYEAKMTLKIIRTIVTLSPKNKIVELFEANALQTKRNDDLHMTII